MTAAATAVPTENNEKDVEESKIILKSGNILEIEKLTNEKGAISSTRDLLKMVREAANQKFAMTMNENLSTIDSTIVNKIVLKEKESPAWHGKMIKIKLKRTTEPPTKKKTRKITEQITNNSTSIAVGPASKSLIGYYRKVRGEYEDFKEIEAVRLQKRLEKFSDFQNNSMKTFEGKIYPNPIIYLFISH